MLPEAPILCWTLLVFPDSSVCWSQDFSMFLTLNLPDILYLVAFLLLKVKLNITCIHLSLFFMTVIAAQYRIKTTDTNL